MGNVSVHFRGGFAWLFDGPGSGALATVGLVKASAGSEFEHFLEMRVDRAKVNLAKTTPETWTQEEEKAVFRPIGAITLTVDGATQEQGMLNRIVSEKMPKTDNDFYHVFKVGRIKLKPQSQRADPKKLTVSVKLPAGDLRVSDACRGYWEFKNGNLEQQGEARFLASTITFVPTANPTKEMSIEWNGVSVVLDAASSLEISMSAQCNCGSVKLKPGDPAPGFFEVYELYSSVPPADRLIPVFQHSVLAADESIAGSASVKATRVLTPGPDCPPTEHEL